jgi:hypothetical protein
MQAIIFIYICGVLIFYQNVLQNKYMNKFSNILSRVAVVLAIYLTIKYLVPNGRMLLYPVNLLVTFLHEFGHSLAALLTGGGVNRVQVSADGSGFTETVGGWRALILMGGYLGSAVFGNLLFYIGVKKPHLASKTLYVLAVLMLFTGLWWFNSLFTTILLALFAVAAMLLAKKPNWAGNALMFLGLASIIHIIEDFNVGPTSDLAQYAETIPLVPASVWMYVWLAIVLLLCYYNFSILIKKEGSYKELGGNKNA